MEKSEKDWLVKLDFRYKQDRDTVQEELWVWMKFMQMAQMYADCFYGRDLNPLVSAQSWSLLRHRCRCLWMTWMVDLYRTHTHTHNRLTAFDLWPREPVPEETFTHSHPSCLSDILYQLPPFTTILFVQFTCLTVLFHNLSPGPIWSSSWSLTLYFILRVFLHPIIIFLQHMPIPLQPVLL